MRAMPAPIRGTYVISRKKHRRCFDELAAAFMLDSLSEMGRRTLYGAPTPIARSAGAGLSQECFNRDKVQVHSVPDQLLAEMVGRKWPSRIKLVIGPQGSPPKRQVPKLWVRLMLAAHSHAFIAFYEANKGKIERDHTKDPANWPTVLAFGRVVRNALAHGGHIDIWKNSGPQEVKWRGIKLSRTKNNGQRLLYRHMTQGDLTLLMLDMAEELS